MAPRMAGEMDFAGRTALVTGAASGIGAAAARWLGERGIARLVLVGRDGEGLAALDPGCDVVRLTGDGADAVLWERVEAEAGALDHAVVNAGIPAGGAIAELTFDEWRRVMAVNLDG